MTPSNPFKERTPYIQNNERLRAPQREAFGALAEYAREPDAMDREVGILLPVGCGKSGCIVLAPFAFKAAKTLVVAPNVKIAEQLKFDFDPSNPDMFYGKCNVLGAPPFPEPAEIRGTTTNIADLEEAHVVVTNIQQISGEGNRWLDSLPNEFFDLILVDEGHHNVANSWRTLKAKFPKAQIVNFSATPARADGQVMAGQIIYSYPVFKAIEEGFVKRLRAIVLNPKTLRYVRREGDVEIEVNIEEVRRLGEEDADFRRSIVTSTESLNTIVDASIRELDRLRVITRENRLKIIASALNYEHCIQISKAYRERGRRAEFVHSRTDSAANKAILRQLENNELDVIVQVRKLGEGFDHPLLSVAAVFSVFANLSPFIQFVGRIMRVIKQNSPLDPLNQGSVVFHAGANVAQRWEDFRQFSEADREYFDQILPMQELDFESGDELFVEPRYDNGRNVSPVVISGQAGVEIQEIPLIKDDQEAISALKVLLDKGYSSEELVAAFDDLKPVPVTRVRQRQALRKALDDRVKLETGRALRSRGISPDGRDLDKRRLGISNFVALKTVIDQKINSAIGRTSGERHEFTRAELDEIDLKFAVLISAAIQETIDAEG